MKNSNLKALVIVIFSVFFLSGVVFSQDMQNKKNPEERAKNLTERLNKTVNLTEEQQNKIQQLYLGHFAKMQTIRESAKDKEKSEVKQSMRESRTELKKGIKDILTSEQIDKLKMKMKMKNEGCRCKRHKRHH